MTTIAWDGTTLAADRCSWTGHGIRRRARKVFRVTSQDGRRFLVAFAGNAAFALAILDWMRGKREAPFFRDYVADGSPDDACCVCIDERRRVWVLNARLSWIPFPEKVFATGAGQEFAWGALEAGASARRAIEIAIKRSDYAGFGVDCVRF